MKPDVMLWAGDNIYYREPDFGSVAAMKRRWALGREEPALQALLSTSHHYAIWDDHDFGPNDATWVNRYWKESFDIFKSYWANPTYGAHGVEGVFGWFSWGDVDFFLLDDRMYRTPERAPDTPDKAMLGSEQLRWLKHSLSFSRAPFKIVVNGSQVLNSNARDECFAHYEREQRTSSTDTRRPIRGVGFSPAHRHESGSSEDPRGSTPLRLHVVAVDRGSRTMTKEEENNRCAPGHARHDMPAFGSCIPGKCNERNLEMKVVGRRARSAGRTRSRPATSCRAGRGTDSRAVPDTPASRA